MSVTSNRFFISRVHSERMECCFPGKRSAAVKRPPKTDLPPADQQAGEF